MARSRTTMFVFALFAAPLVALCVSACGGGGAEAPLIRTYFLASRVDDRATLGNIAMVAFNPRKDGTVSTFTVDTVEEEQSRPLRIKKLHQALLEAQQAEDKFTAEKGTYQGEHFDAINRVLEAERNGEDCAPRDVEVQEAWTDWRNRTMKNAKMVSHAVAALTREQNAASLSVFDPGNPLDLTQYDGELLTKDVSITATVDLNGSQSAQAMVIRLQKAVLTGSDDATIEGRWVIANIS